MYTRYDGATSAICAWLMGDADNFNFVQKLVNEWQAEPDSTPETVLSDLASYLTETLDESSRYTLAGQTRKSLSDADMASVDWSAVLEMITEI